MDNAIKEFLLGRKADRIKGKINLRMTAEEKLVVEQGADKEFLLANWLVNAAKKAKRLSLVSHPSKFSHPSAKTSSVIAVGKKSEDGFLRTGNANSQIDVFGNAADMPIFEFLSLKLDDGLTVLQHLELNSEKIKNDLKVESISFEELSTGLLAIKKTNNNTVTSEKVKQVYFPVADGYHLLSLLIPSGLMFELKNRIQNIRFSDYAKKAREDKRKNVYNDIGFDDLYDLSVIGYGGSKPQNISVLNSRHGGKVYLLSSIPPSLIKRDQRLPKINFFTDSLWLKSFKEDFIALHKLFKTNYNNKDIRIGRDRRIQSVIELVIDKMWAVRLQESGWSAEKNHAQLPSYQKIWLDESRKEEREIDDDWLQKVITECARWFIAAYKKILGSKAILIADDELIHVKSIIEDNKEGLL